MFLGFGSSELPVLIISEQASLSPKKGLWQCIGLLEKRHSCLPHLSRGQQNARWQEHNKGSVVLRGEKWING